MYIAISDMEMKKEADSNDISPECSHDHQPTVIGTGMLVCCFSDALLSAVISMCVVQFSSCCTYVFFVCFTSTYYTLQSQRLVLTPVDHISLCSPTIVSLTVTCMIWMWFECVQTYCFVLCSYSELF